MGGLAADNCQLRKELAEARRQIEDLALEKQQCENTSQVLPNQAANPQHAPEVRSACSLGDDSQNFNDSFAGVHTRPWQAVPSFDSAEPLEADEFSGLRDRIASHQEHVDDL